MSTLKVRLFSIFFWDCHEYKEVWNATCLSQEITPRSVFASYDISGQSSINCVSSVQRNARFRPCPTAEPYVGYYNYPNSAGVCRMAEVCRKGTLGSVLAWRAASLLLIRLLFVLKTSVVRERKRTSCRVSLWGHDSRNTRIPYSWNFSLVPDNKNILHCHVF